jgi:hypothetical protein
MLVQARRGIVTALVLVAGALVLPVTAMAADPVVQFQPIPMQSNGSTLASQEIVKFWSSKNTQDSTPTATVDWGDGTAIDTTTPTATHDGCTATPDASTLGGCPSGQGVEYDVTAGPHTFTGNGPYTVTVTLHGDDQADIRFPFTLSGTTTIGSIAQFAALPPENQGSTLGHVSLVKFWGSSPTNDPAGSTSIHWGDGTGADTFTESDVPEGCTPTPTGVTFDTCPTGEGNEFDVAAGPHTFDSAGPYTLTVSVSAHDSAQSNSPFTMVAAATIPAAACTTSVTVGFAQAQLLGGGCIQINGSQDVTPAGIPVLVNGLELHPASGVSLTLDNTAGTLSSDGGNVAIDLGESSLGQHQTTFVAAPVKWRIAPNPGETSINEGAPGDFDVSPNQTLDDLATLSENGITLMSGSSDMTFTVAVPIPGIAKYFGVIDGSTTILSSNSAGAHFDGLDAIISLTQKPELSGLKIAAPFYAFFGHLDFKLSTDTWNVSLTFSSPGAAGISASTQIVHGTPTAVAFSASYQTPGLAIGDTGAFLQTISGGFTNYPTYSRPRIGVTQTTGNATTDAARAAQCKDIDENYDQYIALNQAFPSYCGQVGSISFDPPLEIDGSVTGSLGPVLARKSALLVTGSFRYADSYFDGNENVPWTFDIQGGVTMVGLPFNKSSLAVYKSSGSSDGTRFAPIDNSGSFAWAEIQGSGAVTAGGGFDYTFPQVTNDWLVQLNGSVAVSFIPKGVPVGAPPAGATAQQYASAVQGYANNWTVAGTITGQICAQIPEVVKGCATGAGGISNNGVGGCASFSVPGTQVLQTIAVGGAKAINALSAAGGTAGTQLVSTFNSLQSSASSAASSSGSDLKSLGSKVGSVLGLARYHVDAQPVARAADVIDTSNIVVPAVNFAIGGVYNFNDGSTTYLSTCSNAALQQALTGQDVARAASAGLASTQVVVRSFSVAPRLFVIRGVTAAPDVLVMGPDRRAIRTYGNGFVEPGWIVYKDKLHKTTFVEAVAAPKGKWDFVAAPHTSRIASIRTAAGVSIPTVEAGIVAAKAKKFAIRYRVVQPARGDVITLQEATRTGTNPVQIARLRHTAGSVKWTPSTLIPSPQRLILAVIKKGSTTVSVQRITEINLTVVGKKPKKPVKRKGKKGNSEILNL